MADMSDHITALHRPIGVPGSGAVRYAAAMSLYVHGVMPLGMLEIYRLCSKFDREDPIAIARYENVAIPPVSLSMDLEGRS